MSNIQNLAADLFVHHNAIRLDDCWNTGGTFNALAALVMAATVNSLCRRRSGFMDLHCISKQTKVSRLTALPTITPTNQPTVFHLFQNQGA